MDGDEFMEEEYTDDEMEDEELQRALLLSMQEVGAVSLSSLE